jgi:hypothetical protein
MPPKALTYLAAACILLITLQMLLQAASGSGFEVAKPRPISMGVRFAHIHFL